MSNKKIADTKLTAARFTEPTPLNEALGKAMEYLSRNSLSAETVDVQEACNRILQEDITAPLSIPEFDRSSVDGYAVASGDTNSASKLGPVTLKVIGRSALGELSSIKLRSGEAVEIATGAILPEGADSVVMVEKTTKIPGGYVQVFEKMVGWQNVSRNGEDVQSGHLIMKKGRRLRPPDLGLLALLGIRKVKVVKRPRVAVLSTGNELLDISKTGKPGKVFDINRLICCSYLREIGAIPLDLGIAPDNLEHIKRKLRDGLKHSDMVIVSAGSSVGKADFVPEAINSLGKPGMIVHGVAIRPALPSGIALINSKPIVSLPGLPVSSMIAFIAIARPILLRLMGAPDELQLTIRAKMSQAVKTPSHLRSYLRVIAKSRNGIFYAEPLPLPGSTLLTTMTRSNGIVVIPEGKGALEAGEEVEVIMLRSIHDSL